MKILGKKALLIYCLIGFYCVETGCKKKLNINQNPNFPTLAQGTPSLVFPAGVLATVGRIGGDLGITGGMWSQYFTQNPLSVQYADIDSYNLPPNDPFVNGPWDFLYPF